MSQLNDEIASFRTARNDLQAPLGGSKRSTDQRDSDVPSSINRSMDLEAKREPPEKEIR